MENKHKRGFYTCLLYMVQYIVLIFSKTPHIQPTWDWAKIRILKKKGG